MRTINPRLATILIVAAVSRHELQAKDKHPSTESPNKDQIVIESHIAVAAGPIARLVTTRHFGRSYVYAVREAANQSP